jgi:8-oxo-dGTP pyrophosphatase MutT (NUDIX family)
MAKRSGKPVRQAAVIAMHQGLICLITSSSGKRWLLPKGNLEHGHKLQQTAIQEAWEEAGLVGTVSKTPVGEYRFEKLGRSHRVVVFRMKVTQVKRDWPERNRRRRRWLRPGKAADQIKDAQLRKILDAVARPRRAA